MVTGQNGVSGKNAQEAVGMATKPGPELAVTRRLSTAGGHVRGMLWKPSCVTLGLAQVGPSGDPAKLSHINSYTGVKSLSSFIGKWYYVFRLWEYVHSWCSFPASHRTL